METDWLNLGETAELLGVHPATVRAWADRGELPVQRTPGGHRRFRRADVLARLAGQESNQATGAHLIIQSMLGRARLELSDGALNQAAWYGRLDPAAKQALRQIGRRLLDLVARFLSAQDETTTLLTEARAIGQAYQQLGSESGLTLVETTRAYLFFREFLLQTVYDMACATGPQGPTDWGRLRSQIVLLTDQILLALIAKATTDQKTNTLPQSPPEDPIK